MTPKSKLRELYIQINIWSRAARWELVTRHWCCLYCSECQHIGMMCLGCSLPMPLAESLRQKCSKCKWGINNCYSTVALCNGRAE